MPRYKLTLEYDGAGLAGFQRQKGQPTVQEHLEDAIENFCGERVEVFCAGRTDAGVHARGQVVHADLPREDDLFKVQRGISQLLFPLPIVVTHAEKVSEEFHARFSATGRRYLYRIINRSARLGLDAGRAWQVPEPLDVSAMRRAAKLLLGTHDFTSFRDSQCQAKSPLKTLDRLEIEQEGEEILVHAAARSFLHHQVRIMVGTLRLVGNGKWTEKDIERALGAKDRSAAGPTAPPDGLYLMEVMYE